MWRTLAILLVVTLTSGCVYTMKSLGNEPKRADDGEVAAPTALPTTVEQEQQRRRSRSTWAVVAGPAEIAAGLLLTYLALFAPTQPSDADTVTGALGDAAKEAAGRAILASVGMGLVTWGIGDLLLGGADRLLRSPFIVPGDDGNPRMLTLDEIYQRPPSPVLQLDPAVATLISTRGMGGVVGLGLAHWPSARLRLRYAAELGYQVAAFDGGRIDPVDAEGERADLFLGGGPSVRIDIPLGRRQYWGRYPRFAITAVAAGTVAWSEAGDRYLGWRAGAGLTTGIVSAVLGASQLHGRDRSPVPELTFLYVLRTD
jgi:hypothetical protein